MKNKSCRILARDQCISNDTWTTGLNNNDLIIGPSGSGKTRGYVLPNLLQAGESLNCLPTYLDIVGAGQYNGAPKHNFY